MDTRSEEEENDGYACSWVSKNEDGEQAETTFAPPSRLLRFPWLQISTDHATTLLEHAPFLQVIDSLSRGSRSLQRRNGQP